MVPEGSMPDLRHGQRVHGRAPASPWQDAGYYTPHILQIVASVASRHLPRSQWNASFAHRLMPHTRYETTTQSPNLNAESPLWYNGFSRQLTRGLYIEFI